MQVSEGTNHPRIGASTTALLPSSRRPGTIPVTVRLDPPRYDRLKRLVRRLSITGQSIIQTALDRSLPSLERQAVPSRETPGQISLFSSPPAAEGSSRPRQDSFPFVRPEPTVAVTYRANVSMHRWLHRRSHQTGQTIQDIIDEALKAVRGLD